MYRAFGGVAPLFLKLSLLMMRRQKHFLFPFHFAGGTQQDNPPCHDTFSVLPCHNRGMKVEYPKWMYEMVSLVPHDSQTWHPILSSHTILISF